MDVREKDSRMIGIRKEQEREEAVSLQRKWGKISGERVSKVHKGGGC